MTVRPAARLGPASIVVGVAVGAAVVAAVVGRVRRPEARLPSPLSTYLHDHLGGATAAIKMVQRLCRQRQGTAVGDALTSLLEEIRSDHRELMRLSEQIGGSRRPARAAVAWVGESAFLLKTSRFAMPRRSLRLFESLEVLSLGIEGKRSLWRSLRTADLPGLQGWDFDRLEQRAVRQRDRVEQMRLAIAHDALGSGLD